jgi:hypothetical protein
LVAVGLKVRNRAGRGATARLVARVRTGAEGKGGEAARHVATGGAAAVVLDALGPGEERRVEGVVQVCFVEEGVAEMCGWIEEVGALTVVDSSEGGEEEKEERWLGGLEGRRRWVVEPVKIEGVLDESDDGEQ